MAAAAGSTTGKAGIIAEGVTKMMMWAKVKVVAACVVAVVIVGGAGAPPALRALAREAVPAGQEAGEDGARSFELKAGPTGSEAPELPPLVKEQGLSLPLPGKCSKRTQLLVLHKMA